MRARTSLIALLVASIVSAPVAIAGGGHGHDKGGPPPGLQKKAARGEPLPPGWQRKLAPGYQLPIHIYHHHEVVKPVDRDGLITVRIDGRLLRLVEATHEIIDILH